MERGGWTPPGQTELRSPPPPRKEFAFSFKRIKEGFRQDSNMTLIVERSHRLQIQEDRRTGRAAGEPEARTVLQMRERGLERDGSRHKARSPVVPSRGLKPQSC